MAIWKTLEQPYAKPRTNSSRVPRRSSRMTSNRKVSRFSVQTRNFSRIWHQFAWSAPKSKASRGFTRIDTNLHEGGKKQRLNRRERKERKAHWGLHELARKGPEEISFPSSFLTSC